MATISNKFFSTVAGAGLAAAGALGMADSAQAEDGVAADSASDLKRQVAIASEDLPDSADHIQVPMSDARHIGKKGVIFAAGQTSNDGYITLMVYGEDQEVLDAATKASQRLIADMYPVRGIIVGPTDEPAAVEFYIDAQDHYRVTDRFLRNHAGIIRAVAEGYKETMGLAPKENPDNPLLSRADQDAPALAQN